MPITDIHTHGIGDYDTKGATPEDILRIAEIHSSHGVDAIIPTVYSGPIDRMRLDIAAVKKAMEMQAAEKSGARLEVQGSRLGKNSQINESTMDRTNTKNLEPSATAPEDRHRTLNIERCPCGDAPPAAILGVHLEGPFLNSLCAGALDRDSFLPAKISSYEQLLEGFGNVVKIITVAPELDGAPDLIRSITGAGIIVNMGHSYATYSEAEAGFNAGAKGITHIFNAMRGIHHREPGITGFGLTNPQVYVEVIADPFHLHPKTIELIFAMKKPDKIIIVSDSVKEAAMGAGSHGVRNPTGRLLGGAMTITESVEYLIGLGFQKDVVEQYISNNPELYLADVGARAGLL
jgi:N-acetylglucosamine-6-phosphate deacetylase